MAADFELEKGVMFGEWLHQQISEGVHLEREPWAVNWVARISERLQQGRPAAQRLLVEIPWFEEITAFTAPGRYIYFGRRLFERCPKDEHVAFVLAHEIAHHDLGHVDLFRGWSNKVTELPGARFFALAFQVLERRLYSPKRECEADRHGLDLCRAAGYDARLCLELFDILEWHALDLGDLDIVYGPSVESDDELAENADWKTRARIWAWKRKRGYLPIRDRRKALLTYLNREGAADTDRSAPPAAPTASAS